MKSMKTGSSDGWARNVAIEEETPDLPTPTAKKSSRGREGGGRGGCRDENQVTVWLVALEANSAAASSGVIFSVSSIHTVRRYTILDENIMTVWVLIYISQWFLSISDSVVFYRAVK